MNGFTLCPSSTLKRLHYENQMPNIKCWTQVTFKDKGHTSNTRPLTTLGAFSPCSRAGGIFMSHTFLLTHFLRVNISTRSSRDSSRRSRQTTGAVKSEDERAAKGKRAGRRQARTTFNASPQLSPETAPAGGNRAAFNMS